MEVVARLPEPHDHEEIARVVEAELPGWLRTTLTPSSVVALHRRITKRVRSLLRHADRRLIRLQDHYLTKDGIWISLEEMKKTPEVVMWNLKQMDQRRREANAEYVALKGWAMEHLPELFSKEDKDDTGDLFDKERA